MKGPGKPYDIEHHPWPSKRDHARDDRKDHRQYGIHRATA